MAKKKPAPKKQPAASRDAKPKRPPLPPLDSPELAHLHPDVRPLAVPIESLKLDPCNANKHDDASIAGIKASLDDFGFRGLLTVNVKDNIVEKGNGTLVAAKLLGWQWISVLFVDDDEQTAARYAIADNRTAQLAEWDLAILVQQIAVASFDDELADALLLDQLTQELATEAEEPPPDEELGGQQVIPDKYSLVIECTDADQQKQLWDELQERGLKCRPLTV